MDYGIYSILDAKTGFLSVSLDQNDASAQRNFAHACKRTDSLFFTHPNDYDLYKVGKFNSDSGVIEPIVPPKHIVSARSLVESEV